MRLEILAQNCWPAALLRHKTRAYGFVIGETVLLNNATSDEASLACRARWEFFWTALDAEGVSFSNSVGEAFRSTAR